MHSRLIIGCFILIGVLCMNGSEIQAQSVSPQTTSFLEAKELFDKGLYAASRTAFEKHLTNYSAGDLAVDATYYRAVSAIKASNEDGQALMQDFVDTYPEDNKATRAFLELALQYYKAGSYKKAVSFYEKSSVRLDDEAAFKIGYSYFNIKEYQNALKLFSQISDASEYSNDAAYFLGFIHKRDGDLESAEQYLEKGIKSEEFGTESLKSYALLLYQQEKYEDVVETIDKEAPTSADPVLLKLLGDSNYELGRYRLAGINYKEFLRKNRRTDAESYFNIGLCFDQLDETERAIENLKKAAISKDSVGAYASYYLGYLYLKESNLVFASTAFKKAGTYPLDLQQEALFAYGKTEFDLENYHTVISTFQEYNQNFPNNQRSVQVNEMLTHAYINNDDHQAAVNYMERLNYMSPNIRVAYQQISYLLASESFNRKNFSKAIDYYKRSTKYPENSELNREANYWIGEAYSYTKKYNESLPYYRKAGQLGSTLAYYGLGYSHYNLKDFNAAARQFETFNRSYDASIARRYQADVLKRLADCYYVSKNYDQAIDYYQESAEKGEKDLAYVYYQSGIVERYRGNDNAAVRSFEKLINEFPGSDKLDDARYQIAQIAYEGGNYDEAIDQYSAYIRKYPESQYIPYALMNQAVAYNNINKSADAARNYKIILDRFSRHSTANSALLGLQELAGRGEFDEFDSYLDKFKKANPDSEALENIEFETAKAQYYNLKYDQCIRSFENFLANYENSELAVDARYFIADSYYRKSDLTKALENFYQISEEKDFSRHNRIIYRIATIENNLGNSDNAITYYRRLMTGANTSKETVNAKNGLMSVHYSLGSYDSTLVYSTDLLENHRISNEIESRATLWTGISNYQLGNLDEAFDWLLLLVNGANDEIGAEAKYYVSRIFYDKEQYDQSLSSLFELTKSYGTYDQWVGKAFLLMADNYLQTDELFQAEATLNSLIENSSLDVIRQEAEEKLKVIKKAEREELIDESDSTEQSTDIINE